MNKTTKSKTKRTVMQQPPARLVLLYSLLRAARFGFLIQPTPFFP